MDIRDFQMKIKQFSRFEDVKLQKEFENIYKALNSLESKRGTATLVAGTVTVTTPFVNSDSLIFVSGQNGSSNIGHLWVSARVDRTSFTISSTNASDTRLVAWLII